MHGSRDVADWVKLLGITTPGKARTVRVHEALKRLSQLDLLQLTPGQPSVFTVLTEDGTRRPWCPPSIDALDKSFKVPIDFWRNRWYLWLTHAEIATLFAVYHGWQVAPPKAVTEGVGLSESVRRGRYEMSGERYTALHELVEFGLLEMVSPSQRPLTVPSGPTLPGSTHHVRPLRHGLAQPARSTLLRSLNDSQLPPRIGTLPIPGRGALADELRVYMAAKDLPDKGD